MSRTYMIILPLAYLQHLVFGDSKSIAHIVGLMMGFVILNMVIPSHVEAKTEDQSSKPLTKEAKDYLANRVQELNIKGLKTQEIFKDYEQDDLRYMGLGKSS